MRVLSSYDTYEKENEYSIIGSNICVLFIIHDV